MFDLGNPDESEEFAPTVDNIQRLTFCQGDNIILASFATEKGIRYLSEARDLTVDRKILLCFRLSPITVPCFIDVRLAALAEQWELS